MPNSEFTSESLVFGPQEGWMYALLLVTRGSRRAKQPVESFWGKSGECHGMAQRVMASSVKQRKDQHLSVIH